MKKLLACVALSCVSGSLLACPPVTFVKKVVAVAPVGTQSTVVQPVFIYRDVLVPTYSVTYAQSPFGIGGTGFGYGGGGFVQPGSVGGSTQPGILPATQGTAGLTPGNAPIPGQANLPPMPPAAQNGPPDARNGQSSVSLQALFAKRCAACHQGDATAAASGGGQVLMEDDGSLSRFSPAELTMISFYVQGKTPNGHSCPPRNPLPQDEQQFVVSETERMRKDQLAAARQASQRKDTPQQPDRK